MGDKLTGDIRPESDVGWVPIWKYFNFRFGGVNTEVTVQLRAWPLLLIVNKRFSSNIKTLQAKNWKKDLFHYDVSSRNKDKIYAWWNDTAKHLYKICHIFGIQKSMPIIFLT